MQIVYVVTSAGQDLYSAMTRVSVASLRLTNPSVKVVVVCDTETDRALRAGKDPLLDEVDEWYAFETPPAPPVFRNRFLKTSLRQRIEGSYLFLDSDTIVRDDLAAIFAMPGDMAAAPNHSKEEKAGQIWEGDRRIMDEMNWFPGLDTYFNGGVLFVRDTQKVKQFYRLWHQKWELVHSRLQSYRDQAALNSAIFESGIACVVLPHRYNAQVITAIEKAYGAAIWHYYSNSNSNSGNQIDSFIQKTMATGRVDNHVLNKMVRRASIWGPDYWKSHSGREVIRQLSQGLTNAIESDQNMFKYCWQLRQSEMACCRSVLTKAFIDAYWSERKRAHQRLLGIFIRLFPGEMFKSPARDCLLHAFMGRVKSLLK